MKMTKSFYQTIKQKAVSWPIVGRSLLTAKHLLKSVDRHQQLNVELAAVKDQLRGFDERLQQQNSLIDDTAQGVDRLALTVDNLSQQLHLLEQQSSVHRKTPDTNSSENDKLFADDHLQDVFYSRFEDRFRGSEQEIKQRLGDDYLEDFKQLDSTIDFDKHPVLDLGSGRGELLSVLGEANINAVGLDINLDMVTRSKDKGLQAVQGDALTHLGQQDSQSLGAITGFHIVEHIPFGDLLRIFSNAHRALVKNGLVIFETPNPENIVVASAGFYMDPSHLNPIPPQLLEFALETVGFKDIEIRRLRPVAISGEEKSKHSNVPDEILSRFYGPRDYAIIARK